MNAAHELRLFSCRKNRAASGRTDLCQARLHKDIRRALGLRSKAPIAVNDRALRPWHWVPGQCVEPSDKTTTEGRNLHKRVRGGLRRCGNRALTRWAAPCVRRNVASFGRRGGFPRS